MMIIMSWWANTLEPHCQTEGDPEVSRGHWIKVNKLPWWLSQTWLMSGGGGECVWGLGPDKVCLKIKMEVKYIYRYCFLLSLYQYVHLQYVNCGFHGRLCYIQYQRRMTLCLINQQQYTDMFHLTVLCVEWSLMSNQDLLMDNGALP